MPRQRAHLPPFCTNCNNFAEILEPEPALDRRGRAHINFSGLPASRGLCSHCGAEHNDILMPPLGTMLCTLGLLIFMCWCGFGVYLFGYWSWREAGGFTGWSISSYIWAAVASGAGTISLISVLVGMVQTWRYLWVKLLRSTTAEMSNRQI